VLLILDRYVIRSLLVNYVVSLTVLILLYIIIDLFVNLDEFTKSELKTELSFVEVLANIGSYYGYNLFLYFAQLSGVIITVAATFTLARMQRSNELTAILASGTSLYRIAAPVVGVGLALNSLWIVDQELIIPEIAHKLARQHNDVEGVRTYGVWFLNDRNNALVSAVKFFQNTQRMRRVVILQRDRSNRVTGIITADWAIWKEPERIWQLERGMLIGAAEEQDGAFGQDIELGKNLVQSYESDLTPKELTIRQAAQWINFMSLRQLNALERREVARKHLIAQVKHNRFTQPFISMTLLILGMSFFLSREPRNLLRNAAWALGVCSGCFAFSFLAQNAMGASFHPALPAWLPLLVFGPLAVVLLDRVKT
jgi:lipopolysaccharide export system permease protein